MNGFANRSAKNDATDGLVSSAHHRFVLMYSVFKFSSFTNVLLPIFDLFYQYTSLLVCSIDFYPKS